MEQNSFEVGFSIQEFERLVKDGKWIILFFTFIALLSTFFFTKIQVQTFKATSLVAYKQTQENKSILNQLTNLSSSNSSQSLESYMPFLKSKFFMEKVGILLLMSTDSSMLRFETPIRQLRTIDWIKWLMKNGLSRAPTVTVLGNDFLLSNSDYTGVLQSMVNFIPDSNLSLITVEVTTTTPDSAALLANKVAEAVQKSTLSTELASTIEMKNFLERELKITQDRLDIENQKLIDFKQNNEKTVAPQSVLALTGQISDIDRKLSELKSREEANKSMISYYRTRVSTQKSKIQDSLSEERSSPKILEKLNEYIAELKLRRLQLLSQGVSEEHEEVKLLDTKINKTKDIFGREAKIRLDQSEPNDADPMLENESILKKIALLKDETKEIEFEIQSAENARLSLQPRLKSIPQKELELATIEMKQKMDNELFLSLSKKYKEIQLQEAGKKSEWEIIEAAVPPKNSNNMSYVYRYIISFISSILAAITFLILYQTIKAPIRTIQRNNTERTQFLCDFPQLVGKSFKLKTYLGAIKKDSSKLLVSEQMHSDCIMNSIFSAIFKLTNQTKDTNKNKVVLVTGGSRKEGKSIFSSNLAIGFANTGYKTLLIDGNFNIPEIQNIFKIAFLNGFAKAIYEKSDPREAVILSRYNNLSILPMGITCLDKINPSLEILSKMLIVLRKKYDVIIIDSGSIQHSSHAMLWAKIATDAIVVAKRGKTLFTDFEEASNKLVSFKDLNIWTCLAGVPLKSMS